MIHNKRDKIDKSLIKKLNNSKKEKLSFWKVLEKVGLFYTAIQLIQEIIQGFKGLK